LQEFVQIIALSIGISLAAMLAATAISLPLGTALAVFPITGRRAIVVIINAFFGLPPVVVGLVLYLALSRSGPLGFFGLLFTPAAMIIAQTILAINRYDVIELNPQKHSGAKLGDAKVFADWLVSADGQQAIGAYQVNGEKLFNSFAASPK
jgi:tungstate transport system permease protein